MKSTIPLGEEWFSSIRARFFEILFCYFIGAGLLVEGIVAEVFAEKWCLRPDCQKRGGTCRRSLTTPSTFSCFALYSTKLRKLFPRRKGAVRNLAAASLGCVRIFFAPWRNNAAGEVYCLRARDRIASTAQGRSALLPYLGPEIIAVMQAAPNFAPNDSRTGARLPSGQRVDTVIPTVVFSSSLRCSDSKTVDVLSVWVHIE
jgi:hypothetical protein